MEYGEIYVEGSLKPLKINLSFILPENSDTFNTDSKLIYQNAFNSIQTEYNYSSEKAVEILKKWTLEKNKIRLLIDDELNIECYISSFSKTTRESTAIKPCSLEIIEYKNPLNKTKNEYGIYKRNSSIMVPDVIIMKSTDTLYSLSYKYNLDFKALAEKNGIKDLNKTYAGRKIYT